MSAPSPPDSDVPPSEQALELAALRAALEVSDAARRALERDLGALTQRRSVQFARSLSRAQARLGGAWRLLRGTGKPAPLRLRLAWRLLQDVGPRRFLELLRGWSAPEGGPVAIPPEADAPPPQVLASPPGPLISILLPVCDPSPEHLKAALESVSAQTYQGYELVLADDGSRSPQVLALLAAAAARPRVKLARRATRGGISAALNSALELAAGEWVCVLDHDDALSPDALAWVAWTAAEQAELDLIYSDEDKLDPSGARIDPFYKPEWSPDLLLSINYLCHLCVLRRRLVVELGGFRGAYDGAQDYDLFLRAGPRLRGVARIPRLLYHWRQAPGSTALDPSAKPYAEDAGRRALEDALPIWGLSGAVEVVPGGGYRIDSPAPPWHVTIAIPTRDRPELLGPCLESLRRQTRFPHEVLIVDNGSRTRAGLALLEREAVAGAQILRRPGPFNFGLLMNEAAAASEGEVLLLLNDDTEACRGGWLEDLVAHLARPGVGAVGPLLRYPDGRIQHAGVLLGVGGAASHAFIGRRAPGNVRARLAGNVSALTGACLAIRREAFVEVGGFDHALLPNSYGDVDLCLRLGAAGWRCLFVPTAELVHHEGASRGRSVDVVAEARLRQRWAQALARDPYGHPLIQSTDLTPLL